MKRLSMHVAFGAAALLFAAAGLWQGWRLLHAFQVNEAIATAHLRTPGGAVVQADVQKDAGKDARNSPAAVLAHGLALARSGQHDAAFKAYSSLIQGNPDSPSGRAALFNLGNMYLRQGSAALASVATAATALPLLELAKKRYRDLLRIDPQAWDARYNLERALRLAPEQQAAAEVEGEPVKRRPISQDGMMLEDLP